MKKIIELSDSEDELIHLSHPSIKINDFVKNIFHPIPPQEPAKKQTNIHKYFTKSQKRISHSLKNEKKQALELLNTNLNKSRFIIVDSEEEQKEEPPFSPQTISIQPDTPPRPKIRPQCPLVLSDSQAQYLFEELNIESKNNEIIYLSSSSDSDCSDISVFPQYSKKNKIEFQSRKYSERDEYERLSKRVLKAKAKYGKIKNKYQFSLKMCHICKRDVKSKKFVTCCNCLDCFHLKCLGPIEGDNEEDDFCCARCKAQDIAVEQQPEERRKKRCAFCRHSSKDLICCQRCKDFFHQECIIKNAQYETYDIICGQCSLLILEPTEEVIQDFFLQKGGEASSDQDQQVLFQAKPRRKKGLKKASHRGEDMGRFLLPEFKEQTNYQMLKQLYLTMEARDMKFSDDLVYSEQVTPAMNNAQLCREAMVPLIPRKSKMFHQFKKMSRQGLSGVAAVANAFIPKDTLIAEYSGELEKQRKILFDSRNDSLMDLLVTPFSELNLSVNASKFANLARFINGVNTTKPGWRKYENVKAQRNAINGRVRIIFTARRHINKGEILKLNYNSTTNMKLFPDEEFL